MPLCADLVGLLVDLSDAGVEFVVVGGLAAVMQGVPTATFDLDVVHRRNAENVERLLAFLPTVQARVRGRPDGQVLLPGRDALSGPGHQLLQTSKGALDLLGTIERGLGYEELLERSQEVEVRGHRIRILELKALLELKRDSPHPKDKLAALLIEKTLEQRQAKCP
jgi:predicted nucleotidyltransferase